MTNESLSSTNITLLGRLKRREHDDAAWEQFVETYGTHIFQWCDRRSLQPADAEDVTQNVLIKIARNIGTFEYDQSLSFRGWLRRITENAIVDYFRECQARDNLFGISWLNELASEESKQDLLARMNAAFDLELFELAMANVRSRIDKRRWLAWKLTARDQRSGKSVATELNMPVASVYGARHQVQKMIADEILRLETFGES